MKYIPYIFADASCRSKSQAFVNVLASLIKIIVNIVWHEVRDKIVRYDGHLVILKAYPVQFF